MTTPLTPIGIDVSKLTLDLHLGTHKAARFRLRVPNTLSGFEQVLAWFESMGAEQVHVCLEATGTYGDGIATFLHHKGFLVSVINPARLKAFRESEGTRGKTDHQDAWLLARFCQEKQPAPWQPMSDEMQQVQTLLTRYDDWELMIQQERNRLENQRLDEQTRHEIEEHMALMRARQQQIKERLTTWLTEHETLALDVELLSSIKGIGFLSAARLLLVIQSVTRFATASQLAAFVGVTPRAYQSGSSIRKAAAMDRKGSPQVRKWLYMCAIVAKTHDPGMRRWAEQLASRGKKGKQILVAIMRKLLHIAYGVLKTRQSYDIHRAFPALIPLAPSTFPLTQMTLSFDLTS